MTIKIDLIWFFSLNEVNNRTKTNMQQFFTFVTINVRENRKGNQEALDTGRRQTKNTTKKMSNMDPTKKTGDQGACTG